MGDQKFQQKIGIIKNLISKFDNLIIVGGMANNIIKYKGNHIGKSIREENCDIMIKEIFETLKRHSCKIIFPDDVLIGKNLDDEPQIKELNNIQDNDIILDIGPKTLDKIKSIIENSETVLEWTSRLFRKSKFR